MCSLTCVVSVFCVELELFSAAERVDFSFRVWDKFPLLRLHPWWRSFPQLCCEAVGEPQAAGESSPEHFSGEHSRVSSSFCYFLTETSSWDWGGPPHPILAIVAIKITLLPSLGSLGPGGGQVVRGAGGGGGAGGRILPALRLVGPILLGRGALRLPRPSGSVRPVGFLQLLVLFLGNYSTLWSPWGGGGPVPPGPL